MKRKLKMELNRLGKVLKKARRMLRIKLVNKSRKLVKKLKIDLLKYLSLTISIILDIKY